MCYIEDTFSNWSRGGGGGGDFYQRGDETLYLILCISLLIDFFKYSCTLI